MISRICCTLLMFFFLLIVNGQALDVFEEMRNGLSDFMYAKDYGEFTEEVLVSIDDQMRREGYLTKDLDTLYAADAHPISSNELKLRTWFDTSDSVNIQILTGSERELREHWKTIRKIGVYSGFGPPNGNFYMRYDSIENNMINLLFFTESGIFSMRSDLSFPTIVQSKKRTPAQDEMIKRRIDKMVYNMKVFADIIVEDMYSLYKVSDEPLTAAERIVGFTNFWTEVKYNFAFFDQVPDLDWDNVYLEYLSKIMSDQSNAEYFRLLEKVSALLEDGHTNIYPSQIIENDYPPISLKRIEGKAIVQNVDMNLRNEIHRGAELLEVDGIATEDYIAKYSFPYISSSTIYIRKNEAVRKMLVGETGSKVLLKFKNTDGNILNKELLRTRDSDGVEWAFPWPNNDIIEFKKISDEVAYVALNTFGTDRVVTEFEGLLDTLQNYSKFIIDLRNNGGGNSWNGYRILKYFADEPFLTSIWQTREHQAAFKAWGLSYVNQDDDDLNEFQLKAKKIAQGDYWHISEPDTIQPDKKLDFDGKIIILTSNTTASAAEDFLVALDDLGIGTLIGQPTYGSTGQPLFINLPRGGSARICTKKDTYPDGREFVGYGIQPDIFVEQTLQDYLSDKDVELEKALEVLGKE